MARTFAVAFLVVLGSGCAAPADCPGTSQSLATASPMAFARGANVVIVVTYPDGTFPLGPMGDSFAGELIGPSSQVVGVLSGTMLSGAVVAFGVTNATTVTMTLNVPASAAAGTYSFGLGYANRACGGVGPTLTFTVT